MDYNDMNKRRITPKFSDKSTEMIMDLNKRSQVYETYSTEFKFLMDLQDRNVENIDLESVRNIIDYYPDDVDEYLVNECNQLKSYIFNYESEFYATCSEIFKLIYEKKLVDVFPNDYTLFFNSANRNDVSCVARFYYFLISDVPQSERCLRSMIVFRYLCLK